MAGRKPEFRIGTSGFQYKHWKGIFYPEKLPQARWFAHYTRHFDTVEINNTFYHLPSERTFEQWREQAPPGFLYALKFSRYATHMKKLKDPQEPIERFMTLAERLDGFLGPILVQLPPRWHVDPERLAAFLRSVPAGYKWAVEFRDESWLCGEVYSILREYDAALCFHDLIEKHPRPVTAKWIYWRFHGTAGHAGNYAQSQLTAESEAIKVFLKAGLGVYVYFNNDVHGYALANAQELRRLVGYTAGSGDLI